MSEKLELCPRTLLVCDRSTLQDERNRLSAQAQQLHFNYKVCLLLPECGSAPPQLDSAFKSFSRFYLFRNLPVSALLDPDFLQMAICQGNVYGLSYRTRIDEDNCVCLTPDGHMTLSLDKDTFELLGVEGKPSRFNHRSSSRFVVSIDLTDSSMSPGGRGYQRLLAGLTSRVRLQTDFMLSHHPGGRAALQPLLSRYDWSEHSPQVAERSLGRLCCPADPLSCDPHSLLEWLGAVSADIDDDASSSFLSSLTCPEPMTTASGALSVSVCGLLLPQDVHQLIQELRCYVERSPPAPWVAVTVHGFADSPVSWGKSEHGALRGGDFFYTLLLLHDGSYHLHMATGASDGCPP